MTLYETLKNSAVSTMSYVTTSVYYFSASIIQVAFLPFGLLIDLWRWDIFSGKINESQWNTHWWELRWEFLLSFSRTAGTFVDYSGQGQGRYKHCAPQIRIHTRKDMFYKTFNYFMSPEATNRIFFFPVQQAWQELCFPWDNESYVSPVRNACDDEGSSGLQ